MRVLLRAIDDDGKEILGTDHNFIKEVKSLNSLLRTNVYKVAKRKIEAGVVNHYRIERFTYSTGDVEQLMKIY